MSTNKRVSLEKKKKKTWIIYKVKIWKNKTIFSAFLALFEINDICASSLGSAVNTRVDMTINTLTIVSVKVKKVNIWQEVLKARWKNQTMTLAQTGPRTMRVHRVLWFCDECQNSMGLLLNFSVMHISLEAHQGEWLCTLHYVRSLWAGLCARKSPSLAPSAGLRS